MQIEGPNAAGKTRLDTVTINHRRHYQLPGLDKVVPSVTTFLNVLDKPGLNWWKTGQKMEAMAIHQRRWEGLEPQEAVKLIRALDTYDSHASDVGDVVHHIFEDLALGRSPHVPAGFESVPRTWDRFVEENDVEVILVEPALYNSKSEYAGSADLIAKINGVVTVVDWKSGKSLYGSTAYQTTAYGISDQQIMPDGTYRPAPKVEAAMGVWVRNHGYAAYPLEFSANTATVVRACRVLFDLTSKDAEYSYKGKPVNPNPIRSAASAWPAVNK